MSVTSLPPLTPRSPKSHLRCMLTSVGYQRSGAQSLQYTPAVVHKADDLWILVAIGNDQHLPLETVPEFFCLYCRNDLKISFYHYLHELVQLQRQSRVTCYLVFFDIFLALLILCLKVDIVSYWVEMAVVVRVGKNSHLSTKDILRYSFPQRILENRKTNNMLNDRCL